jgi:thiosulfate sulfurtransferase
MSFKTMSIEELKVLLSLREATVQLIDIRDQQAFQEGHIDGAQHIGQHNVDDFVLQADMDKPLVVCCYSGMMSQSAAQHFFEQGFSEVYSLAVGYYAWKTGA